MWKIRKLRKNRRKFEKLWKSQKNLQTTWVISSTVKFTKSRNKLGRSHFHGMKKCTENIRKMLLWIHVCVTLEWNASVNTTKVTVWPMKANAGHIDLLASKFIQIIPHNSCKESVPPNVMQQIRLPNWKWTSECNQALYRPIECACASIQQTNLHWICHSSATENLIRDKTYRRRSVNEHKVRANSMAIDAI